MTIHSSKYNPANVHNLSLSNLIDNREQQQPTNNAEVANNINLNNIDHNINNDHDEDIVAGNNRDWLDNFYMLSRLIILFSIVYFYSSPLRFIIVTFLGFLVYLYHIGFFRNRSLFYIDNNNAYRENNNQLLRNDDGTPVIQRPLQNLPENENIPPIRIYGNNANYERQGVFWFTWTFFSSFFASMVPEQPNVT